jgi:hypothetical protein
MRKHGIASFGGCKSRESILTCPTSCFSLEIVLVAELVVCKEFIVTAGQRLTIVVQSLESGTSGSEP